MQNEIIQSMHDQVRAIYRAFTGHEVADGEATEPTYTVESITRRFAELESIARAFSSVMELRPPVTFTPQVDIIAGDTAVIVEVALPGVERDAIVIDRAGSTLVISGIRASTAPAGRLFHTELPRGPFYRAIPLPFPIERDPRVELEHGVLRIFLTQAAVSPADTRGEGHDDEDGEQ